MTRLFCLVIVKVRDIVLALVNALAKSNQHWIRFCELMCESKINKLLINQMERVYVLILIR